MGQREWDYVEEISKQFNDKFIDYIPRDMFFDNYRPSINQIYVSIKGKHKAITWNDIINKKETKISLPTIGTEISTDTGHIRGALTPYTKIKGFMNHHDLTPILGEETGEYPNTKYPKENGTT